MKHRERERRAERLISRIDPVVAEQLPLRHDAVALLTYLRDHKVTGTQGRGNLPLKAVREVNALFSQPCELDIRIGDYVRRLRSEENIWPIWWLDVLARVGGLLTGGSARRIRVTRVGERFLQASPTEQVWRLADTWWWRVNWLIAYPFEGMGEALPPRFSSTVLDALQTLPVGERIPFEEFADRLIAQTGLKWGARDPSVGRIALRGAVNRMVIGVLDSFGAVERIIGDRPVGKATLPGLVAFRITPFGAGLLASLR